MNETAIIEGVYFLEAAEALVRAWIPRLISVRDQLEESKKGTDKECPARYAAISTEAAFEAAVELSCMLGAAARELRKGV